MHANTDPLLLTKTTKLLQMHSAQHTDQHARLRALYSTLTKIHKEVADAFWQQHSEHLMFPYGLVSCQLEM